MAFQEGAASNLNSFFTSLRTFAASNGFTNNGTRTVNTDKTLHTVSKGGIYWNFEETLLLAAAGNIKNAYYSRMRMTYDLPAAEDAFTQTSHNGQPRFTAFGAYSSAGPYTKYYFFSHSDCIHAVLEIFPNVFSHLSFGVMTKYGTWTGGEYLTASSCRRQDTSAPYEYQYQVQNSNSFPFPYNGGSSHNAVNTGGVSSGFNLSCRSMIRNVTVGTPSSLDFATAGEILNQQQSRFFGVFDEASTSPEPYTFVITHGANSFNQRASSYPMYAQLQDISTTSHLFRFAGILPGVRMISTKNIVPKEIVDTNWQVFSASQKDGDDQISGLSGSIGITYLRS